MQLCGADLDGIEQLLYVGPCWLTRDGAAGCHFQPRASDSPLEAFVGPLALE